MDRGYTGHEHLQSVGLIHMNGRLYDPKLHRFLQTDNYVQDPGNTQNYNSYGYVLNNPLKYTDPSGWLTEVQIAEERLRAQRAAEEQGERSRAMADWYAKHSGEGADGITSQQWASLGGAGVNSQQYSSYINQNQDRFNSAINYAMQQIDLSEKKVAWDSNDDGILQKSEADNWGFHGKGKTINVDNSLIDWKGLKMPLSTAIGGYFDVQTHNAFLDLPFETASTYGGTRFQRTSINTADVQDQLYHYDSRDITLSGLGTSQGWRDLGRNVLNSIGEPSGITYSSTGLPNQPMTFIPYMIHYLNPSIKFNN